MTKITFKPIPGQANCHSVFKDGKLVGEFRFIRDRVITTPNGPGGSQRVCTIATAGNLTDFESNGEYDLGCFAWFKDVKRHIEAHYTSKAARLRPTAYRFGQELFREGDTVKLNPRTASRDRARPRSLASTATSTAASGSKKSAAASSHGTSATSTRLRRSRRQRDLPHQMD
jgi:hypothetical protein